MSILSVYLITDAGERLVGALQASTEGKLIALIRFQGDAIEERSFRIVDREWRLSGRDRLRMDPRRIEEIVPLGAKMVRDIARDDSVYRWSALKVDADEFDWLFDHPSFEPAETDRDPDRDRGAELREEIARNIARSIEEGYRDCRALTGVSTSTVVSTAAAAGLSYDIWPTRASSDMKWF